MTNLLPSLRFIQQPNGYTCGTTALYGLGEAMGLKMPPLLDLADEMGTNPYTGTTDKEMTKGLQILNLPVLRYAQRQDGSLLTIDNTQGPQDAFDALKAGVDRGEAYLLRTLMQCYHWVLVYGYDKGNIMYMCSCAGPSLLSPQRLFTVWSAREFDGFRVNVERKA